MPRKKTIPETIEIDTNRKAAPVSGEVLSDRVQRSRRDRVFLSRWIGGMLLFLAIANIAPAAMQIYDAGGDFSGMTIPRWIYIQLFIAFLHAVFAFFLLTIPDWSSLRSVSFVLLIFAALFGFVGAALFLAGGDGEISKLLELPFSFVQRAKIWCVAMLLVELFGSYVAGIEAMNWKKMEQLFQQVSNRDASLTSGKQG